MEEWKIYHSFFASLLYALVNGVLQIFPFQVPVMVRLLVVEVLEKAFNQIELIEIMKSSSKLYSLSGCNAFLKAQF